MVRESLLGSLNILFVLEQLFLTLVRVQQTVLRVVNITHCYISDITSTRCVASTSTWRPFYSSHTHTRSRGTLHQRSAVTFRHVNALYLRDTLTSSLAADPHHRALHKRLAGKQLGSLHGLESWEYTREILQWHQMCCMKSRYKTSSLIVRVTFLRIATEIKTTRNAEFSRRS